MTSNAKSDAPKLHPKVPTEIKPGHILRIDYDEIDQFQERAQKFRIGDEEQTEFQLFRLSRGVYGQRQEDNQMMRIKLPAGGVTSDQLEALADVSEKYSGLERGHITTRENFQFHFVNLDDTADVMRIIGAAGLTTREACAHTVRNVTGCPFAGICHDEEFDTTPYLAAYARNMLRNPICQRLPRKFKTAFSGCASDCAGTPFHDLGFLAKKQTGDQGNEVWGFELRVGGGTSTMPRQADVIWDFARVDNGDYIKVAEAILRVFDREGDLPGLLRKNLNKARIKFLLHKIGAEAFKAKVVEELEKDWAKNATYDMEALTQLAEEGPSEPVAADNAAPMDGYERWRRTNVQQQKQDGFYSVSLTIAMGNLVTFQFRELARVMRQYSGGNARTNQNQNMVLRYVRPESLPQLYRELNAIGLGDPDADLIADVVACPGADSCKLAITASNQAGYSMREHMIAFDYADPEVQKVSVKISGCPNGCGQHHLAGIGLQGSSYKVGKLEVPCYDIFVGGAGYHGAGRYATRVSRVLAKKAHLAIDKILQVYQAERTSDSESFFDFVDRVGPKHFEQPLEEFKWVGSLAEDTEMYMDWGQSDLFEVIRGEGECAAGEVPIVRVPTAIDVP
ncbi:MAG: nitrite/sulfite reductase [Dehalococcoidia bacterium]|nr:nitrite/sulfite reductase [Dehalococcoidia bacterium]